MRITINDFEIVVPEASVYDVATLKIDLRPIIAELIKVTTPKVEPVTAKEEKDPSVRYYCGVCSKPFKSNKTRRTLYDIFNI